MAEGETAAAPETENVVIGAPGSEANPEPDEVTAEEDVQTYNDLERSLQQHETALRRAETEKVELGKQIADLKKERDEARLSLAKAKAIGAPLLPKYIAFDDELNEVRGLEIDPETGEVKGEASYRLPRVRRVRATEAKPPEGAAAAPPTPTVTGPEREVNRPRHIDKLVL